MNITQDWVMTELNGAMVSRNDVRTPIEVNVLFAADLPSPLSPEDMSRIFDSRYGHRLESTGEDYTRVSKCRILDLGDEVQRMIRDAVQFIEREHRVKLPGDAIRVEILIGRSPRGSRDPDAQLRLRSRDEEHLCVRRAAEVFFMYSLPIILLTLYKLCSIVVKV